MYRICPRPLLVCLFLGLLALSTLEARPCAAQGRFDWNQPGDPYVASIGFQAGWSTGTGLSLRWPILRQFMMSVTGAVYRKDGNTRWNLGGELHLVLRQQGRVRLYAGPSLAAIEGGDSGDPHWNAALAVGIEYLLLERLALKGDLGFVYRGKADEILPLPQGGLYFYF